MTRRDFGKDQSRRNVARRGAEAIDGSTHFGQPRKRKPKSEARRETADMMSPSTMITKLITCECGHSGKVRIPIFKAGGPFRCVSCRKQKR